MLDGVLQTLYNEDREMTFKELGTTKTKAKPLIQLKLIEERKIKLTKTTPKTPNGAIITEKGIAYVISSSNSDGTKLISQLNIALKDINDLRKETKTTLDKISSIEASLLKLNQSVKAGGFSSQTPHRSDNKLNLKQIRDSYLRLKSKSSPLAPLGQVMADINKKTGQQLADMKYQIYEFFIQNKLELVGGQSNESSQYKIRDNDGTEYSYIRM